jgi:anti-anti-sigma regulatory factor
MKALANNLITLAFIASSVTFLGAASIGIVLLLRSEGGFLLVITGILLVAQILAMVLIWQARIVSGATSESYAAAVTLEETHRERNGFGTEQRNGQTHQQQMNAQFATPVIPIAEGIVIIPFVGAIDSAHMQHIRASLLDGIAKYQSKIAIVDLTGIDELPGETVQPFMRILSAADLMGCRIVLTGINASTARPLLKQGLDLPARTCRNLQAGIAYATDFLSSATTSTRPTLPN